MCLGLFHNPQHDAAKAYVEADASCSVVCCGRDVFGKAYRPSVLAAKMVLYIGILAAIIGGIVASSLLVENGARADLVVWFVAFAFAAVATITSLYDITRHLLFYVQPELQLHYVRIREPAARWCAVARQPSLGSSAGKLPCRGAAPTWGQDRQGMNRSLACAGWGGGAGA